MCVWVYVFSACVRDCEGERKVRILVLCAQVGVCLLERRMKKCVFSGFAGCVCACDGGSINCQSLSWRAAQEPLLTLS